MANSILFILINVFLKFILKLSKIKTNFSYNIIENITRNQDF